MTRNYIQIKVSYVLSSQTNSWVQSSFLRDGWCTRHDSYHLLKPYSQEKNRKAFVKEGRGNEIIKLFEIIEASFKAYRTPAA